jgi:hypothetical protein
MHIASTNTDNHIVQNKITGLGSLRPYFSETETSAVQLWTNEVSY